MTPHDVPDQQCKREGSRLCVAGTDVDGGLQKDPGAALRLLRRVAQGGCMSHGPVTVGNGCDGSTVDSRSVSGTYGEAVKAVNLRGGGTLTSLTWFGGDDDAFSLEQQHQHQQGLTVLQAMEGTHRLERATPRLRLSDMVREALTGSRLTSLAIDRCGRLDVGDILALKVSKAGEWGRVSCA